MYKLRAEAYTSTLGLLTDSLNDSLIFPHNALRNLEKKNIVWPNFKKVSGSKFVNAPKKQQPENSP